MKLKCDNCGYVVDGQDDANSIKNLHERVEPGGIMPGGECPKCEALMYPTADEKKTIKLRLTLDVEYIPNGASLRELKSTLEAITRFAADKGLMTGDSPAEVDDWKFKVEKVK